MGADREPIRRRCQAEAIHQALELPVGERRARLALIRAHVREHDPLTAVDAQLADLDLQHGGAQRQHRGRWPSPPSSLRGAPLDQSRNARAGRLRARRRAGRGAGGGSRGEACAGALGAHEPRKSAAGCYTPCGSSCLRTWTSSRPSRRRRRASRWSSRTAARSRSPSTTSPGSPTTSRRSWRPERLRYPQLFLLHKRGFVVHEPLGAVAVVAPWNFPFSIPFTCTATAVAAGNAVVVKPAEQTPLVGAWIERAFAEAGAPAGFRRHRPGDGPVVGDALVRARGVAKVFFTGSTDVGRSIGLAAAERLRPVVLELGGKDPMLVLDDADLGRAVAGAAWGSFFNCGQVCVGIERIYVAELLRDEFVPRLADAATRLRIGDGAHRETELGPLDLRGGARQGRGASGRGRARARRRDGDGGWPPGRHAAGVVLPADGAPR